MLTKVANNAEHRPERGAAERIERQARSLHRAFPFYLAVPFAHRTASARFGVSLHRRLLGTGVVGLLLLAMGS